MADKKYAYLDWYRAGRPQPHPPEQVEAWFSAVKTGDLTTIAQMLDDGFDIDCREQHLGITAVAQAVRSRQPHLLRFLIERGADLEYKDCYCFTALTHAIRKSRPEFWIPGVICESQSLAILEAAGARLNLIDAVLTNNVALAETRLKEGANPNHGERSYDGPVLMQAARLGYVAIIDLLLDHGANIEGEDDLSQHPLMCAADSGQFEAVKRLIERGADINAVCWANASALAKAAVAGHREITAYLISQGARRGIVDALVFNEPTLMTTLLDESLRKNSNIDWISDGATSIAQIAAGLGNSEMLRLILDRGASHTRDFIDHSLLAEAARHGQIDAMRLLIERGARLDVVGLDGLTPLEWAVRSGQEAAAEFLRQAGASDPSE